MAVHKLAILVEAVGAAKASKELKGVDKALSNIGARAGRGIQTAGKAIAVGVGAAAVGIGAAVKAGIDSLTTLESGITAVDGAVKTMGQTGKVSGAQVARWANEIEASVQSAFDDKDITAATAALIRYGGVAPQNLRRTMVVMGDMAAKTGDVGQAGVLLAKAMVDPVRATGILRRAGVVLTAEQVKQLKSFGSLSKAENAHYKALKGHSKAEAEKYRRTVLANKQVKAQSWLLGLLEKKTKGAAASVNGPMKDAQLVLADTVEDAQRALAEGFLPVLMRVQKWLAKSLGDPSTLESIRSFGKGVAGAFDNLVSFAEKIDWGKIGSGLRIAADWGGKLVGAISKMPPEALAAIVALGGLNKLSGGAISGIVGELGKGLIKGVLGITAGVVNVNGGVVKGGPGIPGIPGGGGGGGPSVPGAAGTAAGTGVLSVAIAATSIGALALGIGNVMFRGIPTLVTNTFGTGGGNEGKPMQGKLGPSNGLTTPIFEKQIGALIGNATANTTNLKGAITSYAGDTISEGIATRQAIAAAAGDTKSEGIATRQAMERQRQAAEGIKAKQAEAVVAFRAAERTFANQKPPVVNVSPPSVRVYITASNVTRAVALRERYNANPSRSVNNHKGSVPG